MTTIREIAKACGVSITTVSNILHDKPGASEETKKAVLETIEKMDYRPNYSAQNLKMKFTKTVGVIVEDMTVFNMPEIVDGITEYCEEIGHQIILTNLRLFKKYKDTYYRNNAYGKFAADQIRDLLAKRVDGIIYVASHERMIQCIPRDLHVPVVVAYGYTDNEEIPAVVVDDTHGGYEMMNYIVSCGHKNIGILAGKSDSIHTMSRLKGCQKALFENGILYNPEAVCYGNWDRESGYACAEKMLQRNVTAIFCMNDVMAGGVYDYLLEKGMTPGNEISVAGYDNRTMAEYYSPPLTTINLPLHNIGYQAGKILYQMIKNEERPQIRYQMKGELIARKSVKILESSGLAL